MESKLIKVKTDGDILRDAYVISGLEIEGSEYVVYYIDRDDGENDNIFASKLINNNDGTYNMLNIENANEKINVTNTVKELIMKAIEDSEHDTLEGTSVNLRSKTVKLCPVLINKEQAIDIQKTYITTVKKSVTAVAKKYYGVQLNVETPVSQEEFFPAVETPQVVAPEGQQPVAGIVSSVTSAPVVETPVTQTVPTVVEPVLPTLEVPQSTTPAVATPVAEPTVAVNPTPVVNVQTSTPVLDIPAGIISEPVAQPVAPAVASAPVVEQVVVQQPVVAPAVAPVTETPAVVATPVVEPVQPAVVAAPVQAAPVVQPANVVNPEPVAVVNPAPVVAPAVVQPEPEKIVLDASKESNLNSALGEISKEAIAVTDINAIKEFGEEDTTPETSSGTSAGTPAAVKPESSVEAKPVSGKAGFANSKFFMFIAVGFFIASCVFMGYEAFNYYQIVK